MEIKFPARDKLNQKVEILIQSLSEDLKKVNEIKSDLVKFQKYEQSAEFREVEKYLENTIEKLKKIVGGTTHNNVYKK